MGVVSPGAEGYSPVMRMHLSSLGRSALGFVGAMSLFAGCADVAPLRDVRATIVDEAGNPIPGAVFVAESFDSSGPIDRILAVAGEAGEIPDSALEPDQIGWRPGASLRLVALAPGRHLAVLGGPGERPVSDGAVLVLVRGKPGDVPPPLDPLVDLFTGGGKAGGRDDPGGPSGPGNLRNDPIYPALEAVVRTYLAERVAAGGTKSPSEERIVAALEPGGPRTGSAPGHPGGTLEE